MDLAIPRDLALDDRGGNLACAPADGCHGSAWQERSSPGSICLRFSRWQRRALVGNRVLRVACLRRSARVLQEKETRVDGLRIWAHSGLSATYWDNSTASSVTLSAAS